MVLLLDIGNTHVHCGLAGPRRVVRRRDIPTTEFRSAAGRERAGTQLRRWVGTTRITGIALGSVVPDVTGHVRRLVQHLSGVEARVFDVAHLRGLPIDYPRPETLGVDRLANALAARHHLGFPVVAVGFGTATIFDVVNRAGDYVGGVIAPGLGLMTRYLHERTALLPEVRIREPRSVVGRNTEQAMLSGAVFGYRGLVREVIGGLARELGEPRLAVVATGGDAPLLARHLPEITRVMPGLTLEGLRLWWTLSGSPDSGAA